MSNTLIVNTIRLQKDFLSELKKKGEFVIGVYYIRIIDWKTKNFLPQLVLTKKDIYLSIGKNYIHIPLTKIKSIDFHKAKKGKLHSHIQIKYDAKEKVEFLLVEVDRKLKTPSEYFTKECWNLLKLLEAKKTLPKNLLVKLPDQRNVEKKGRQNIILILTSISFITSGLFFLNRNYFLGLIFIFIGLQIGLITMVVNLIRGR